MQRAFYTICELSEKEKHDILREYVPDIDMNKFKSEIESLKNKNFVLKQTIKEISVENTELEEKLLEQAQQIQELANKNQENEKIIAALSMEIERLKANASQLAQRLVSQQLPVQKSKPVQMLSDKELVVKEITDSWEEIIKSINDGTYRYKYQIGNYKPLSFGGLGTVNMQIAAFDADELSDGSGKALVTWISKEILTEHRMNPFNERIIKKAKLFLKEKTELIIENGNGAVGGWEYSEMRKFLEDEIRPLIPETVRSAIKTVKKYTYTYRYENGREQKNGITEDALWIPSKQEIFGDFNEREVSAVYYNVLFSNNALRVKTYNKYAAWWWLRSAFNYASFSYVYTDGSSNFSNASYTGGVVLGFCM